ncbi:MAG: shikimate kinase [Lachnospiraceae bacterium]
MEHNNIILIGMPGVGKSTAGVVLAKLLGYQFLDADLLIQKEEGRLLKEIIRDVGTEGFLKIEERVNASIQAEQTIIATGGSVVYEEEAMAHLKEIGTLVYLHVPFEHLEKRLSDIRGRGVVLRAGQSLLDLYHERTPLYEKYADIKIDEGKLNVEETVEQIVTELDLYQR